MLRTYRAIGDIDLATVPALATDLRETVDASDEVVVSVDCSGVTFMDSSGFYALVDATLYAARRGHALVIRDLSPSSRLLLRICDWDHQLRTENLEPYAAQEAGLLSSAVSGPSRQQETVIDLTNSAVATAQCFVTG